MARKNVPLMTQTRSEDLRSLALAVEHVLSRAPCNAAINLAWAGAVRPVWLRTAEGLRKHSSIWGVRIACDQGLAMARSGWIYARLIGELPRALPGEAELYLVGKGELAPVSQFSLMSTQSLLVAFGADARRSIDAVVAAVRAFDPGSFDDDGYHHTPGLHAA